LISLKIIEQVNQSHQLNLKIRGVSLLGSKEKVQWSISEEGLKVKLPSSAPDEMAVVLKIKT